MQLLQSQYLQQSENGHSGFGFLSQRPDLQVGKCDCVEGSEDEISLQRSRDATCWPSKHQILGIVLGSEATMIKTKMCSALNHGDLISSSKEEVRKEYITSDGTKKIKPVYRRS